MNLAEFLGLVFDPLAVESELPNWSSIRIAELR